MTKIIYSFNFPSFQHAPNHLWALLLSADPFSLHRFLHRKNCKKKKKKAKVGREYKKKVVFFLLELEDAIISKVNNHNGSIGRHGHTGGAIHLSEAAPLRSEFA